MQKQDSKKAYQELYLEQRLREWGNWCVDIKLGNEGWPKESLVSKMMILGILISNSVSKPPISHPRAEQVNYWINLMTTVYPLYAQAIELYYMNTHMPLRILAKELKVSVTTLKERVHDGKVWLNGLLSAFGCYEENR